VSEDRYPILVERFRGNQVLTVGCQDCSHEFECAPDDIRSDCSWTCRCGGWMTFKYVEADYKCPGCDKLHFDRTPYPKRAEHGTCFLACSRVCHLQDEYARSLVESAA
jgi:hypothetical protein